MILNHWYPIGIRLFITLQCIEYPSLSLHLTKQYSPPSHAYRQSITPGGYLNASPGTVGCDYIATVHAHTHLHCHFILRYFNTDLSYVIRYPAHRTLTKLNLTVFSYSPFKTLLTIFNIFTTCSCYSFQYILPYSFLHQIQKPSCFNYTLTSFLFLYTFLLPLFSLLILFSIIPFSPPLPPPHHPYFSPNYPPPSPLTLSHAHIYPLSPPPPSHPTVPIRITRPNPACSTPYLPLQPIRQFCHVNPVFILLLRTVS